MAPGEVVLTASGRRTAPFPRFSLKSVREAGKSVRAVERWLLTNALEEALHRRDDFNAVWLRQAVESVSHSKGSVSQADKDAAEEYLFGGGAVGAGDGSCRIPGARGSARRRGERPGP